MEKCAEKQKKTPLGYQVFSQEFKENNLGLFSPKKDQCDICTSFDSGNLTEAEYTAHQIRKAAARAEKDKDKETDWTQRIKSASFVWISSASSWHHH